ncbi:hypothetical protein LUCX_139 [Xanthomonas phage vB_XciM_LucasX]|nr:hypothetical protein LUCX_139 [Xanthomonas phage vB_XciM_LucasX]
MLFLAGIIAAALLICGLLSAQLDCVPPGIDTDPPDTDKMPVGGKRGW